MEKQLLKAITALEKKVVDLYHKVKIVTATAKQNSPYGKVYLATLFSQNINSGSPAVVNVGHNDFSAAIVWTNLGNSAFRGTLTGAFTENKTFTFNNNVNGGQQIVFTRENNNSVLLVVRDSTGSVYSGSINTVSLKIEVTN